MSQSPATVALQCELVIPKGAQEGECLWSCSHQIPASSFSELQEAQDVRNTGYWPRTGEVHMKGMISVSTGSCIFPCIEKCSVPWDIWFSFINNNSLMFQLPARCCKTLSSPPHLPGAVSQSYMKCNLLGYSPHFPPNKTKHETLMLCFPLTH